MDSPGCKLPRLGRVAARLLLLTPLPFLGVAVGIFGHAFLTWLTTWGTTITFALGGCLCLARAWATKIERLGWISFTLACGGWTLANFYYAAFVAPAAITIPSVSDIGYVTFPIVLCGGFLGLARPVLEAAETDSVLDGVLIGLAAAAVAAVVMFKVVLRGQTTDLAAVITTLLYPVEDLVVLGCVVSLVAIAGPRVSRGWLLAGAAVPVILISDALVFGDVLAGSSIGSVWPNLGWTLAIAMIANAAWIEPQSALPVQRRVSRVDVALPVVAAGVSLAVLFLDAILSLGLPAAVIATLGMSVSSMRLGRAFREIRALAESRRLALTDDLTGLPNRRSLLADLANACETEQTGILVLFDLDGFKRYNDAFGHPQGDVMLASLAAELARALPPDGRAYRLGGDEFCVLAPVEGFSRWIREALAALNAEGPGWSVTASHGSVELPREADEVTEVMRLADTRMYNEKARRPAAARIQARNVLLSALGEQQPGLHTHTLDVTNLAATVARELGLSEDEIDDVVRAAELHDIGKLAMPPEILDKPDALTPEEWVVMRRHTEIGERMLLAAPALASVAPLVRASHERWDGGGYPDGLIGERIPIGARIVAICDTYDAIVSDRVYRRGRTPVEALAEIRRCAGTQFDPVVVDAFAAIVGDVARETA